MAAPEGDDRGVRIVNPPGHLHGLLAKRHRLLALRPVELDAEPSQHLRAERTVVVAQPLLGLIEQLDEAVIGHSGIAEASTGSHHGAGEEFRSIEAACDIGGLEASLTRLGEFPCLDSSFPEFAQELPTQGFVPAALERERVDGVAQVMRRFLIGPLLLGYARGLPRIFDRQLGVAGRRGPAIVVRDLGKRLRRGIETSDRFGDDSMQSAAIGGRQERRRAPRE